MTLLETAPHLRIGYRSASDNLVRDFYDPCLERTVLYRRAVGYFTSSGLAYAARGVAHLVENGGTMRLVASPCLEEADVEALKLGVEHPEEVLRRIAARGFSEIEALLVKQRLNALAWLIAKGALEVRLAIRVGKDGRPTKGIYHEKVGIFTDIEGNHIAFAGSSNETAGGLVNNFESIKVFWSWDDPHGRVAGEIDNFESLWANETDGLRVLDFTAIAKDLLQQYKLDEPPQAEKDHVADKFPPRLPGSAIIPSYLEMRDYQILGLEKWKAAGGRGILAMATGAGKTVTALYLACRMHEKTRPLVLIVVCPYINLARQWVKEMRKFSLNPICCFGTRQQWDRPLEEGYTKLFSRSSTILTLVVVNRTFLSESFRQMLRLDKFTHLLVADEVHNLGSDKLQKSLDPRIKYRLGLSATPERHSDEEGTKAIFDYFGDVVYEFPLKEAIRRDILCRYYYYPVLVRLTDQETKDYWNLTLQIARALPRGTDKKPNEQLKHLLIRRARLLGAAAEKLPALQKTITAMNAPVRSALVYCGDGRVENSQEEESVRQVIAACRILGNDCGLRVRKFTCEEPDEEREAILENLRSGTLDAVVAIRCLDEGIDVPDIRMGFILASSTNPRQFIQRRGRLLRKTAGKDFAHIWDFIVEPPDFSGCSDDHAFNVERRLFQRELSRIIEFCDTAENGPTALQQLHDLQKRYNLIAT